MRGGSGLGDSLYQRPLVDHFIRQGEPVTVCSEWPDVFDGSGATVEGFSRNNINVLAHYSLRRMQKGTNQYEDICIQAGVQGVPLRFDRQIRNRTLVDGIRSRAQGRRVILLHGGRTPMDRKDNYGATLLPDESAFAAVLDVLNDCYVVEIGSASNKRYALKSDLDLNGKTSVSDLLDLGAACDGIVAQCSFCVPLAEAFDKPLLAVWSSRGLVDSSDTVKSIRPEKILSKRTSTFVMDDWPVEKIQEAARAFYQF